MAAPSLVLVPHRTIDTLWMGLDESTAWMHHIQHHDFTCKMDHFMYPNLPKHPNKLWLCYKNCLKPLVYVRFINHIINYNHDNYNKNSVNYNFVLTMHWKEYSLLWEWVPCACTSLIELKLSHITKLNDAWIQIIDYITISSMYTTTTKNKTVSLTLTPSITCTQPFFLQEWTHNDNLEGEGGGHKAYLVSGSHILYYFTFFICLDTKGHKPNTKCIVLYYLLHAECAHLGFTFPCKKLTPESCRKLQLFISTKPTLGMNP